MTSYNAIPKTHKKKIAAILVSHNRTVARECCKGDDATQWRSPKFDAAPRPNPASDSHTNRHMWLRRGHLHLCKSSSRSAHAGDSFPRMRNFVHQSMLVFVFLGGTCNSLQPRALDGFWRKITQKMRFREKINQSINLYFLKFDVPFWNREHKISYLDPISPN